MRYPPEYAFSHQREIALDLVGWKRYMKQLLPLIFTGLLVACVPISVQNSPTNRGSSNVPTPTDQFGARTFQDRCELCHGSKGLGEGVLALTLKDYPNTNLLKPKYSGDPDALRQQIIFGGSKGDMHELSPPWGDELTWTEIESLVLFITLLRSDSDRAFKLLAMEAKNQKPSIKLGRLTFKNRCALCHGPDGEGNGKMAKIIKDPPPFNLTQSGMPEDYLIEMVTKGGEKMQRSPRMPPFGGDLSDNEIKSVVSYILTLRNYK